MAYSLKFIIHFKNVFFDKVRTGYIPEAESVVLKGTVKEKMKGGIGRKLITLALDRDP